MTTVFTNGCFDILHVGHVRLLRFAKSLGDNLVVGLNSDASVRHLKGDHRPVIPEEQRQELLLAIRFVDQVILFSEATPANLIEMLRPDVLVKGPDYSDKKCCGAEFVMSYGGRVEIPDWPVDVSTSSICEKMRCS